MTSYLSERQQVLDACIILADRGFIPGTGGNVAMRVSPNAFAVTPTAADYYTMKAEDICVLRLDNLGQITGQKKPSVEAGIHARFLRFRSDFIASIHTHQPIASAATLVAKEIPLNDPEHRSSLGPVIPVVPYAPSGTGLLARTFARRLRKDCTAYLLRNHGVVCGGQTMVNAIENVAVVEHAASEYLKDLIANRDRQKRGKDAVLIDQALQALEYRT